MPEKLATQLRYGATLALCGMAGILLCSAMIVFAMALFGVEWTQAGRVTAATMALLVGGTVGLCFGAFVLEELS